MSEENKKVVRDFVEICQSQHNLDRWSEFVSDEFINHTVMPPFEKTSEGAKELNANAIKAFPDLKFVINELIAEGDKVFTYKTLYATHQGEFMGIPATGKKVEVNVMDINKIVDGKMAEHWSITDMMAFMMQLGAMNPPG